ncbi:MAG: N-acetylmuramoyl-L-alanine amidase [bacterium]
MVFDTLTVEAELLLGREQRSPNTLIEPLLRYMGLVHHRSVHPHCLSRGQRKKVAFLSILGPEIKILLSDEPTTGLDEVKEIHSLKYPSYRQANFIVLRAPDIPSVLVEVAFITNKDDERLLNQSGFQEKIAKNLFNAILKYLK